MSTLQWQKLASFPFSSFSQPFVMNNSEFIVLSASTSDGIYTFDAKENKWTKIVDLPFKTVHTVAYDQKHGLLYARGGGERELLIINITTGKQFEPINTLLNLMCSKFIFVENKLHKIGGLRDSRHSVYNDKTKQFHEMHQFESFDRLTCHRIIHLKSKKCILLFGGRSGVVGSSTSSFTDSIYQFSCLDAKWTELKIKLPMKLASFGITSTRNEQYVIILGGRTEFRSKSDCIFIYDTVNNRMIESRIKCPWPTNAGCCHRYAVTRNNPRQDEILTLGYVNQCYKAETFADIQILPFYLIQLISRYFSHEEIHLLSYGAHWKINVDYILQCSN